MITEFLSIRIFADSHKVDNQCPEEWKAVYINRQSPYQHMTDCKRPPVGVPVTQATRPTWLSEGMPT